MSENIVGLVLVNSLEIYRFINELFPTSESPIKIIRTF